MINIRLRSEIIEAGNIALRQQCVAAEARVIAETTRRAAEEHSLAANMKLSADADMVNRLSFLNKEKEAQVTRLHE
eukprot:3762959-Heterocapsa_arctica.AAC.1